MTILEDTTNNCTVLRETKGKLPRLPFVSIKNKILGKSYTLSLVFATEKRMRNLSISHKGDATHMNVLSFPYEKNNGEIIIHLQTVRISAKKFEHSYEQHLLFLVIHGMLHLKGFKHGRIMEEQEAYYLAHFSILLRNNI